MANEKKYSAQEAAMAVLATAKKLLAKSSLLKEPETLKKSAEFTSGLHTVEYYEPLAKAASMKKDGSIQSGIAAAGGGGNTPINSGVVSSMGGAFGKKEVCDVHKKEMCKSCNMNKGVAQPSPSLQMKEDQGAGNKEQPSSPPADPSKPVDRVHSDFETKPGHSNAPDHREEPQTPPQANPKEAAEGNNAAAGSIPGRGLHKLMYFVGHTHAKKKMKKGIALG